MHLNPARAKLLTPEQPVSELALCYLNRLGDLLFVLARYANASAGLPDVVWRASEDSGRVEG